MFQLLEINQLTQSISNSLEMLWFPVGILFIVSGIFYLFKIKRWFLIALIVILISQFLIIVYWNDAKYGAILSIIVLIVRLIAFGNYHFNYLVQLEPEKLFKNINPVHTTIVTKNCLCRADIS